MIAGAEAVAVIVPTHRRPEALRRAVRSVIDDTSVDEVIIVDDASPEGPPRAEEFGDPRVRILHREENGGVAAAQNSGLFEARSPYVAFLHSDDEWLPGRSERQLARFRDVPAAGAVESATRRLTVQGERVVPPRMIGRSAEDLLHRAVRGLHVSGFLFRRKALLELEGFDEELRCYEDLDLLIRLAARYQIVVDFGAPVVKIDQRGSDRLGHSPWMRTGRLHLVRKYETLLDAGELPPGWRDWCVQVAADLLADPSGDTAEARLLLRRARAGSARRTLSALPLLLAAHLPSAAGSKIASWRLQGWHDVRS